MTTAFKEELSTHSATLDAAMRETGTCRTVDALRQALRDVEPRMKKIEHFAAGIAREETQDQEARLFCDHVRAFCAHLTEERARLSSP